MFTKSGLYLLLSPFCLLLYSEQNSSLSDLKSEINSSMDSSLQRAKNESKDFEAALVKPSVVVIESVDRIGREGGRGPVL